MIEKFDLRVDDAGFIYIKSIGTESDELINSRRLLPDNVEEAYKELSNPDSKLYEYRKVRKSILQFAIDCVNQVVSAESDLTSKNNALGEIMPDSDEYKRTERVLKNFRVDGYYNARIRNTVNKVAAVLSILCKHRGEYNLNWFNSMVAGNPELKYNDVTYLAQSELRQICGSNHATDYLTIKYCLEYNNVIKCVNDKWAFKSYEEGEDGVVREIGENVSKAYWINPEVSKLLAQDSELVLVKSYGIFDSTVEQIKSMPMTYFAAIQGLLHLNMSEEMYEAALTRLNEKPSKISVRDGFEEADENDPRKYQREYLLQVPLHTNEIGGKGRFIGLTYTTANCVVAIHNFDLFTLLRYTIDDYSGRLHTVLTRLATEVRSHLRWDDGEEVIDIDIQSCQPKIYCATLAELGYPELAHNVGEQDFYKWMHELLSENELDAADFSEARRKELKLTFMQSEFGTGSAFRKFTEKLVDRVKELSNEEKASAFRILCYDLADGKSELNRKDGIIINDRERVLDNGYLQLYTPSALPKRMQMTEVRVMFGENGVAERLIKAGIMFSTIHDAILVKKKDAVKAKAIMHYTFDELLKATDYGMDIVAKTAPLTDRSGLYTWYSK